MTETEFTQEQLQGYLESVGFTASEREDNAIWYFNNRMVVAIEYDDGSIWIDLNT